jgi:type I restriction-modification system DNA methylase subunit
LYQFYISEENERLIKSKKAYKKNELAPASQLFTPKWIVKYMVDNTLGQILTEFYPTTTLTKKLEFYIKPAYKDKIPVREKKKLEEIKFFDPCVGSAHILSYAFDVYYLIYKEQGYNESEIPELIICNNLYGTDIDERAAQLSCFILMMKGRQYYRRFLKKKIRPNITFFKDFEFDNKFCNAGVIGSLIKVEPNESNKIVAEENSLFNEKQKELRQLYEFLGMRYDIVVTNPPYISSDRMESSLKQYIESNYPETKSDLFAAFILRCLEMCTEDGLTGYMSPFVWMFISSYEKLRKIIIEDKRGCWNEGKRIY